MAHALPDSGSKLQAHILRLPRWAWTAIAAAVLIPVVVLGITILVIGLTTGFIVLAAILVAYGILSLAWRLTHRKPFGPANGGRENVQIFVRSARVIDHEP